MVLYLKENFFLETFEVNLILENCLLFSGPYRRRIGRLRLPGHVRDGVADGLHVRAGFRRRADAGQSPQIEIHPEI